MLRKQLNPGVSIIVTGNLVQLVVMYVFFFF